MSETSFITSEQFVTQKHTFADGGQWMELVQGRVLQLDSPDVLHGNVVMNLSKTLAEHFQQVSDGNSAYACFELGLRTAFNPDTVRFPAISLFFGTERFSETDQIVAEKLPQLVIEIASTSKRRQGITERIEEYLSAGIENVWVIDTNDQEIHIIDQDLFKKTFGKSDVLRGTDAMSSFEMAVASMFEDPTWWNGP